MIGNAYESKGEGKKDDEGFWRRVLGDDPVDRVMMYTLAIIGVGFGLMLAFLAVLGLWFLLWNYPLAFVLLLLAAYPLWRLICRVAKALEEEM